MGPALKARWVWAATAAIALAPVIFFPAILLSAAASKAAGVPVRIASARWVSFDRLEVRTVLVRDHGSHQWLSAEKGLVAVGWSSMPSLDIELSRISLRPTLLKRLLRGTPQAGQAGGLDVSRAALRLGPGYLEMRRFESEPVEASGSVRWDAGRVREGRIDLFFSASALQKMPEPWRERLEERGGRRHLHCELRDGEMTLYAKNGPLLRASWEMVY